MGTMQKLRELCSDKEEFPQEILAWIAQENLWNLWVPKSYGGLEQSLVQGLKKLRSLAQVDGSLGWTVTLCSGANFFVGNLQREVAGEIFLNPREPVCFGGSGGVHGTAEKQGEGYVISGRWRYATGAPYLSHFTLNASLREAGRDLTHPDGTPLVRSFLLKKENVGIIKDWTAMGLKATATNSFEVPSQWVHAKYSFQYNDIRLPHPIFKVDFPVFADLTLWANYIGMAARFREEAKKPVGHKGLKGLSACIAHADSKIMGLAQRIEEYVHVGDRPPGSIQVEIHREATRSVSTLSMEIIGAYPMLGIRASRLDHPLNQAFRDYFTATQHPIFSQKKT